MRRETPRRAVVLSWVLVLGRAVPAIALVTPGLFPGLAPTPSPLTSLLSLDVVQPPPPPIVQAPLLSAGHPVSQTVGERIAQDSKRVGLVARHLVDIQIGIDHIEKEVLGKVFDMQSMKSFEATHQAVVEESERLKQDIPRLIAQASSLADQLRGEYANLKEQDTKHVARKADLLAQIAAQRARLKSDGDVLRQGVAAKSRYAQETHRLQSESEELRNQTVEEMAKMQSLLQEFENSKVDLEKRHNTTVLLQEAAVEQQQYADICENRTKELEAMLHSMKSTEAQKLAAEAAEYTIAQESAKRHAKLQQELLRQSTGWKARLTKAKADAATIQSQLLIMKQKFEALQKKGEIDVSHLYVVLNQLQQQQAKVESELRVKISDHDSLKADVERTNTEVQRLHEQLLEGGLARERANNTLLREELVRAQKEYIISKMAMLKYKAQASQANATAETLKEWAAAKGLEAQTVARNALAQVVGAKQEADEIAKEADSKTMEAESAALVSCNETWDKEHPEVIKELEQCPQLKMDVQVADAQVAALTSNIQSSQPC